MTGAPERLARRAPFGRPDAARRTAATRRSSDASARGSTAASAGARGRPGTSGSDSTSTPTRRGDGSRVVVELLLQAADDPTLALPASLLRDGDEDVFAFLRDGDPRGAIERRLETIGPILADAGLPPLDAEMPEATLDNDQVRALLARARPRLEELGVPVLLPRAWVASPSTCAGQPRRGRLAVHVQRAPDA